MVTAAAPAIIIGARNVIAWEPASYGVRLLLHPREGHGDGVLTGEVLRQLPLTDGSGDGERVAVDLVNRHGRLFRALVLNRLAVEVGLLGVGGRHPARVHVPVEAHDGGDALLVLHP